MKKISKITIIGNNADGILRFRGPLIQDLISRGHHIILYFPYEKKYIDQIEELRLLCQSIRFLPLKRSGLDPIYDLVSLITIIKYLLIDRPDVVISYSIKPSIYGSIAAKLANIPKIISVITGLGYSFYNNNLKQRVINVIVRTLLKISLKFCNKVIFFNNDDRIYFIRSNIINIERSFVINGSGVIINTGPNQQGGKTNKKVFYFLDPFLKPITFLMAARFLKEKGIYEYLSACKYLKQKYNNIRFYLAGKPDDNPSSLSLNVVREIASSSRVDLLGYIDLSEIMKEVSVYVLPSYREGLSRSILEAMAMGRPIITTDAPGCKETVINGYNGIIVPVKNIEALIKAMEKFILNPNLIKKMGKSSRKLVEKCFDANKINEIMITLIEKE
jgi:glycosyltransferase involved in cell wall biosynthesis